MYVLQILYTYLNTFDDHFVQINIVVDAVDSHFINWQPYLKYNIRQTVAKIICQKWSSKIMSSSTKLFCQNIQYFIIILCNSIEVVTVVHALFKWCTHYFRLI